MVVALDKYTKQQVEKWGSTAVFVRLSGQEEEQALKTGSSHSVSGKHVVLSCFKPPVHLEWGRTHKHTCEAQ
jgi:hypothetical protein